MMHRRTFLAALAAPAFAAPWKSTPPKEFLSSLPSWMDVAPVPGVWVTWIEGGKVSWSQGFGVRNTDTKQAVDAETIFEAASLSKQVTAYVAHALHSEGKLDFDKPLYDYVPDMTDPKARTVTARHVLSHSSGFPNWRGERGEALVPAFEPRSKFQYSGEGYVYLSRVIEKVADKPFCEVVQERVFDPLGMASSSMIRLPDRESRMATGHDRHGAVQSWSGNNTRRMWALAKDSGRPITSWRYSEIEAALVKANQSTLPNNMQPNAAASICTSGPDYAKFVLRAIQNPEYRKLQTKIREGSDWALGWGLGWGIERAGGREFLWQWGDNGGYKNFVLLDPVAATGIFVFTNGDSGMRICDRVITHATGMEHPAFLWL
jgi:CubicO group peptidase (beta-lactamase class C family)